MGGLIYLTHNVPNISFVVNMVLKFMHKPHESHWRVAKLILKYLQWTMNYGIFYLSKVTNSLLDYINSYLQVANQIDSPL